MSQSPSDEPVHPARKHPILPLSEHICASFRLALRKSPRLLLLGVYALATVLMVGLTGIMLLLLGGCKVGVDFQNESMVYDWMGQRCFIMRTSALFSLVFVVSLVVAAAVQAASIQIIASVGSRQSTLERYQEGFLFAISILAVWIAQVFFVLGGSAWFLFPALAVAVFVSFSSFVVVLEGKRSSHAVWTSIDMIWGHKALVFSRILLYFIVSSLVFALGDIALKSFPEFAPIISVKRFLFHGFAGMFYLAYSYLLYEQVRGRYIPKSLHIPKKFLFFVSSGWIVLLVMAIFIIRVFDIRSPADVIDFLSQSAFGMQNQHAPMQEYDMNTSGEFPQTLDSIEDFNRLQMDR